MRFAVCSSGVVLAALGALGISPVAAAPGAVSAALTREFQAGVDAYRLGKYDDARAHLEKAQAIDPKLPGPHRFLAAVAQAQRRWADCIAEARRAMQLNPQSQELAETRKLHDACRGSDSRPPYPGEIGDGAAISVTANVAGATVRIGGLRYGGTPVAPRLIKPGVLQVELEKSGYKPARVTTEALPAAAFAAKFSTIAPRDRHRHHRRARADRTTAQGRTVAGRGAADRCKGAPRCSPPFDARSNGRVWCTRSQRPVARSGAASRTLPLVAGVSSVPRQAPRHGVNGSFDMVAAMTSERRARIAAESAPTPRSGAASAPQRRVERPRLRVRWIRHAAAVVAGTTIGGGVALYAEPAGSPLAPPASAVAAPAGPSTGAAPSPGSPAGAAASPGSLAGAAAPPGSSANTAAPPNSSAGAAPSSTASAGTGSAPPSASPARAAPPSSSAADGADLRAAAIAQVKDAARRFATWSRDHFGARCPDATALGARPLDPWSRPLRIVCADQPVDQIAGVLSLGPDGLPGTPDDVASWTLGPEVTDLLHGPRWVSSRSLSASPGGSRVAPASRTTTPRATASATLPAAPRATAPVTSLAAGRTPGRATSAASRASGPAVAPATSAASAPAVPAPATPPARPAAGAGSDDIDGDGIPDRR